HYLEWKAKEYNFNTHFIALAGEINRKMPEFVVERTLRLLAGEGIPIKGAKVLVLGVAYKKDIGDYRESPAIRVIQGLRRLGLEVQYHDPHVPRFQEHGLEMESVDLTAKRLEEQDLVLITTDHSAFDYPWILEHARRVLDTRGATRHLKHPKVTFL
ncbi:MAG: UDP binding domain-containing protein, partial [Thermus sp.]